MPASAIHPSRTVVNVPVRKEDADSWQQALIRGQEQGLRVERVRVADVEYDAVRSSRGELWYAVDVVSLRGRLATICSCEAGRTGTICKHSALVLNKLDLFPFPIASQTKLEV